MGRIVVPQLRLARAKKFVRPFLNGKKLCKHAPFIPLTAGGGK
jgi:hypothetical protein